MLCVIVCVLCVNMFIAFVCFLGVLFVHSVRMLELNAKHTCTLNEAHRTHAFTTQLHTRQCTRAAHTEIYNTCKEYMRVHTHKMQHPNFTHTTLSQTRIYMCKHLHNIQNKHTHNINTHITHTHTHTSHIIRRHAQLQTHTHSHSHINHTTLIQLTQSQHPHTHAQGTPDENPAQPGSTSNARTLHPHRSEDTHTQHAH